MRHSPLSVGVSCVSEGGKGDVNFHTISKSKLQKLLAKYIMDNPPQDTALIKVNTGLERVSRQIAITNKLLQAIDPILIPYRKKDKWGFCTPDKKIVIECVYDEVKPFNEGIAVVKVNNSSTGYGYINEAGYLITSRLFEEAYSFKENIALIKLNSKYGFIDRNGEEIIQCKYDGARNFSEGLALVKLNDKTGFIDKDGIEIIPTIFYKSVQDFSDGLAFVRLTDNIDEYNSIVPTSIRKHFYMGANFFVDKNNSIVLPKLPEKNLGYIFWLSFSEGLAAVKGSSFIDTNGKYMSFETQRAKNAKYLNEVYPKLGFINKDGKEVIPVIYEWAGPFSEGLACVEKKINNDKYNITTRFGFINKNGEEIIPFEYGYEGIFSEGLAAIVMPNPWGKRFWGYIDKSNNEIIPFQFNMALPFSNGIAKVEVQNGPSIKNNKWGYIDKRGTEYWEN